VEHGIMPLWNIAKPLLKKVFPQESDRDGTLQSVETSLNLFHAADKNSQTFRYHCDKAGNSVDHKLPEVDIAPLLKAMAGLHSFFNGCADAVHERLDLKLELEAEARSNYDFDYGDFDGPDW